MNRNMSVCEDTMSTQTPLCHQQKPQYQPQLQIIQMVGPNENDYIYINFKDFEYNPKWEFPRENLELGMNDSRVSVEVSVLQCTFQVRSPRQSENKFQISSSVKSRTKKWFRDC